VHSWREVREFFARLDRGAGTAAQQAEPQPLRATTSN
jgi:hypothetical protein